MSRPPIYIWKNAPFIRLLVPLIAGIILQWYLQITPLILWALLGISITILLTFFSIPFFQKYKLPAVNGVAITALFLSIGGLLTWNKDTRHDRDWFGKNYIPGDAIKITITEKPIEKTNSYKVNASVDFLLKNGSAIKTTGMIILYFKKDSLTRSLDYGSQFIISKDLQQIKNSGNPGGFDYQRYSLFQGITHQVYLKPNEFRVIQGDNKKLITQFIFSTRLKVLNILRANIKGDKERGLAEALLIGYKDDLDKTLVQSYSNTGVVHVIAISGLHLGLIYWLLLNLFKPLGKRKNLEWLKPVFIIAGLWLFSLLAGAQASVIRSAVMFTCIALAETVARKTSIYNTLAFSAFLLLCYNPYWLWDVGFQLSYLAVLSIVIFMHPIYNWFYCKNKALDFIWKLTAVSLAAQILTIPVSIYHFHQFPASFVFTNFLAVPLSSIIILGEILLCGISFIPSIAMLAGKILYGLIWLMNSYIERIEMLPYSLWDGLQIDITQAILLLLAAASIGYWLMEKNKTAFKLGLTSLFAFCSLRTISFMKASRQQKIIVYNVPQKMAIDFIDGRHYSFIGDSDLVADDFIRNFHIKPSRVKHRIGTESTIQNYCCCKNLVQFNGKRIMILDRSTRFNVLPGKLSIDLLIISGNPKLYLTKFIQTFAVKQIVFDGSVSRWKMRYWKKDCDSLHIAYHNVTEDGALVLNVQ
jgi:competence protein ComEC